MVVALPGGGRAGMRAATLAELAIGMGDLGDRELFRYRTAADATSWSYGRAAATLRRVAALLQRRGMAPGQRVMIQAPNSPEWAIAFLGAALAGMVAVPIDLRFQAPFLKEVRDQTGARLLFTAHQEPDPGLGIPILGLKELAEALSGVEPEQFEPVPVHEDDLAEILYTSGTTTHPRGVMLTHRNLLSELEAFQPVVPPEPRYRFLSLLPLSHIFEQMGGLLLPITRGGTVVYMGTLKPLALSRALETEQPNAMMAVPWLLELLRDRAHREMSSLRVPRGAVEALLRLASHLPPVARRWIFRPVHRRLGGHLKYLVVGGAALDPEVERFWDAMGVVVLQGYGLTETASAVSCNRVHARRIGSTGQVLPNRRVSLAPDGEILVQGPNVTPGYYGRPDLTAEAFEDGWLRTGDLGRFDRDGYLFVRGRKKELIVTSSGINVYPVDVEAALARVAGVRDSAVVDRHGAVHAVLLLLEEGVSPVQVVREANAHLDPTQRIRGYTVWPHPDFPRTPTMKVLKREILDHLRSREAEENKASA